MLGIPGDPRIPQNLEFSYSPQKIIDDYTKRAGHDAPIRLCGACGILTILSDEEVHKLSLAHKKIQILTANCDKLDSLPEKKKKINASLQ